MTKPTIILRATKGDVLTSTEVDSNFTNLQNATLTLKANTGGTDVASDLNGTVTLVAGSNVTITGDNTAKTVTIAAAGGIASLSTDTNPTLGANLNVDTYSIVSPSNGNITIDPSGTGTLQITKSTTIQAQGELRLADSDSSNYVGFKSPATVTTNKVWTLPSTDGTSGQVLSTNGSATLSWTSVSGGLPQAIISSPASTAFVNTKRISWTTENSDPSSILTLTSASGYFTLAAAGTYLLEQPMLFTMSDPNSWSFRNETTATALTTFSPSSYGGTSTFTPWFYIFTVAGTNNNFSFQNPATVNTSIPSTVYLKITKLA